MKRPVCIHLRALLAAVLLFAGCGSDSGQTGGQRQSGSPPGQDILRVGLGTEPTTLDPNMSYGVPEHRLIMNLMEPLVRLGEELDATPAAALRWEHNDDFTEWTFYLNPEARWSNGDPVTAHDFVYSIRRILDPANAARYASMVYGVLQGGEEYFDSGGEDDANLGVEAIDDHTLRLTLKYPVPHFLGIVNHTAWYPVHRPTIEEHGENWWQSPDTHVGNGAFTLGELQPKESLRLNKSETYWDAGRVYLDAVEFIIIESESSELAAFRAGDIDMTTRLQHREAPQLRQTPEYVHVPMLGVYYVAFNISEPPFDDVNLRRALALSIDRELITERITRKGETPALGFVGEGTILPDGRDYREVAGPMVDTRPMAERVADAKAILVEAGYGDSKPMPRASFMYNTRDMHRDIAEALQTQWAAHLGMDVNLENVEWGVYLSRMERVDYQFRRGGWIADYLDPMTFLDIFLSDVKLNSTGYDSEEYDALVLEAQETVDPERRIALLADAERLLVQEDVVVIPLFNYVDPVLQQTYVEGVIRTPVSGLDLTHARIARN